MDNAFTSRFLKGVMSTGIASILNIASGFVSIMVAVRHVSKEHYGVYILMFVTIYSLVTISDLGLNMSVTKHITGQRDNDKFDLFNTMLCFKLLSSVIFASIIFAAERIFFNIFKSDIFFEIAIYIPILFVFESLRGFLQSSLQGFHHYKHIAVAQVIFSWTSLFLVIIFLIHFKLGIKGLIYAKLIALISSITYQMTPFYRKAEIKFERELFKGIFNFGFPLGLNSILSFVFTRIDTILIGAFLAPIQVAYYGTASKIPDACRQLFESFRSVFFPNMSELFSKHKTREAEKLLENSLRLISFFIFFSALLVYIFRYDLVRIIFSSRYLESAPVLALLMISLSIGLIGNLLGTSLVAAGHSKLPMIINIVDTSVNVVANIIMIPKFGVTGAAYAAILSRLATNPVNVWFLGRYGIRIPVAVYVKPIIIFVACILLIYAYDHSGAVYKLFVAALYPAVCLISGTIKGDDFATFSKCLRFNKSRIPPASQSSRENTL